MSDEHKLPEVPVWPTPTLSPKTIDSDIQTLEEMKENLDKRPVEKSQLEMVETSLAKFVDDSFDIARSEFEFQRAIQAEIVTNRLKTMTDNQIIALISNTGVNSADKIAKTMNPWVQLATARQQAQIQAESAERTAAIQTGNGPVVSMAGSAMKEVNRSASKEVLQGMDALSKILEFAVASAKKESETTVVAATEVKPDEEKQQP